MSKHKNICHSAGFTLVELAVVVAVIALMLGSILVPLATQVDQRNVTETQRRMEEIREALIGYAMANGRFPCPASTTSRGAESFTATGNATNGDCSNFYDGFVPAVTLGVENIDLNGYALDAWGLESNRIRYAVAHTTIPTTIPPSPNPYTKLDGIRKAGLTELGRTTTKFLSICGSSVGTTATDCGTAPVLADSTAVVVVFSLGKNAPAPFAELGADEQANQGSPGKPVFISRTNSAASGTEFDDLVTWISKNAMFSRMVAAGQLP